ncbi:PilW family protein [Mycetocola miduiensis]|uniref:Type IV pilin N-term methylation site GFxxxE n=1 Tax=Mycetocola miduiensis TaxID=995034 RepID=A0A1I5D1E1_9MICO|nr:prepilin-type N-terminal cleavage/methylation domain-containing protein [Mycetocola miduiensis]SFN93042.1 Type IV pilin N-term methylation site GFxxxE [Mycetocola miduiensis]
MKTERGFTLIELLVYMMLATVVLLIVGGILINSLKAEQTVRKSVEGADTGQLISQSVTKAVRNASAIRLTAPAADSQLLTVRTTDAASEWVCRAWYYGSGEVRMTTSATAIATPTESEARSWTLLGDDVREVAGVPVFTLTGADRQVDLTLEAETGAGRPVLISTSAFSRQPVPATGVETAPCF